MPPGKPPGSRAGQPFLGRRVPHHRRRAAFTARPPPRANHSLLTYGGSALIVGTIGFSTKSAEEQSAAKLRTTDYREAGPLWGPLASTSLPVQRPGGQVARPYGRVSPIFSSFAIFMSDMNKTIT